MLARLLPGSDPDRLAAQLAVLRIRAQHLTALPLIWPITRTR